MDVSSGSSRYQSPKPTPDCMPADYLHPLATDKHCNNTEKDLKKQQLHVDLETKMRGIRFDSGVADLEQVNTQIPMQQMPSTKFRPTSTTKTYDYADSGYHQYEELPHARLQNSQPQLSPDSVDSHSSNGTTVTSGVHSEADEGEQPVQGGEERKRYNPLYDTMINTSPTIYNKVNNVAKARQDNSFLKQIRILKLAILFLLMLSLSSFCLSLYLVISRSNSENENLRHELSELETNYSALSKQMKYLEAIVAGNKSFEYINDLGDKMTSFESQTKKNLSDLEERLKVVSIASDDQVSFVYQNITSAIGVMSNSVQYQLDNISKMPGPQGPQGVGNLTACYMKTYTAGSKSTLSETATPYRPQDSTLQHNIVMFATCSLDGGQYSNIRLSASSGNNITYSCVCYGQEPGVEDRTCRLHVWLCPRETTDSNPGTSVP